MWYLVQKLNVFLDSISRVPFIDCNWSVLAFYFFFINEQCIINVLFYYIQSHNIRALGDNLYSLNEQPTLGVGLLGDELFPYKQFIQHSEASLPFLSEQPVVSNPASLHVMLSVSLSVSMKGMSPLSTYPSLKLSVIVRKCVVQYVQAREHGRLLEQEHCHTLHAPTCVWLCELDRHA